MFAHLRVHSHYSLCRGTSSPEDLLDKSSRLGMRRLALTDNNGLYGAPKFYKEAKRRGITPILGAVVDDPGDPARSAVVLAADRQGFADLCRLLTRRHLEEGFDLARALEGLGECCRVLVDGEDLLRRLRGGSARGILRAEITPRALEGRGAAARRMSACARELGVPLVATADVHFADPGDRPLHLVLRAIGTLSTVPALPPEETAGPRHHLASPGEMAALFREFPEAVREAGRLADECNLELDTAVWKYPVVPLPPGETPFSLLWELACRGLAARYRPVSAEAARRLVREMEVIDAGGFAPYFLLVHDILSQARAWGLRHVGRGSAANSIVSYCLGFTAVDPLALNLYFERFMNPSRTSPPDIDLDFSWKERDRVLEHVYRRYGEDRVAMISTHVTFGPRAAIRETARALGLGPEEIGPITRRIPHWGVERLEDIPRTVPECRDLPFDEEPWAGIVGTAQKLLGFPHHLSVHPGGIIVAPEPLSRWCPLERAGGGQVITQYDMHGVEDMGLIKIDLLSQRSLGVLEDVLAELPGDIRSRLEDIPRVTADGATRALVREGRTMGVFYVESPAMRSLLRKLQTDTFAELTAASSVIRPGVAESGMMAAYIDRHRRPEKRAGIHPLLRGILGETYGVMIYQEDVMRVAHQVAGLSLADADLLRRSMSGKLRSRKAMGEVRGHFLEAAARRGVAAPMARELWRQIESFAGYAFCKAHSASYAVLSFQLAYLKAHHPALFMAAVLSNGGGFYSAAAYIQECRRLGLAVLSPDVNRSEERYIAEGEGVRVGLGAVKGLTRRSLDSLLAARREGGPFPSLRALAARTRLNREELDALIRSGACDSLGESRPALLWHLASLPETAAEPAPRLCEGIHVRLPPLADYSPLERCATEQDLLGFPVAAHPLELYRAAIPRGAVTAAEMARYRGRRVTMAGWPISYKRIETKKGETMKFLSCEDLTGTFEAVIFPSVYRRCAKLTVSPGPLLMAGKVEEEYGVCSLTAEDVGPLRLPPSSL